MKAQEMLNKVKELVGVELEQVSLAQATLKNGTVIESENFNEGEEVFIVTEDEKVAMPVGAYELEDGEELVVEQEGIIKSIGAKKEEEAAEEELTEESEVEQTLEEDEEKKMDKHYATKTELEEVKKMVEEVRDMIKGMDHKDKEEMSAVVEEPQKVKHSPEAVENNSLDIKWGHKRPMNTTLDRVLERMSNFNK